VPDSGSGRDPAAGVLFPPGLLGEPAAPGRPSAADMGAAEYTDGLCSPSPALRAALISAIARLNAHAIEMSGNAFDSCAADVRVEASHALESAEPSIFDFVRGLVNEAYYPAPVVLAALEHATGWRSGNALTGSQMDPFDESLLERVRSPPPGYRAAS